MFDCNQARARWWSSPNGANVIYSIERVSIEDKVKTRRRALFLSSAAMALDGVAGRSDSAHMILIRNAAAVVTLDAQRRILRGHSMLMENGIITRIGPTHELERDHLAVCSQAGRVLDASTKVVVPAWINTHVHTAEHLSRGLIPDDLSTFDWASEYATPFCAALSEEEAYVSARLACFEMLSNGTGTFVDTNVLGSLGHLDAVMQAVAESGMRAVLGRGVSDQLPASKRATTPPELVDAILHRNAKAALDEVKAAISRTPIAPRQRVRVWASIYGLMFYASDELFTGLRALADAHGVPMAFHIASSREEAALSESRNGVWPISHLQRLGVLNENLLLTHCTFVRDEEVATLAERGTNVAYCPGAALRLAKGTTQVGKIPEMLQGGVTVSLGGDGVSSSGTFDPLRLAFLSAGLFKDARMDPRLIPAETALELLTVQGAKAVQAADSLGTIEVGRAGDVALYDCGGPEWAPGHDIARTLVYSVDGRSVHTVIVDGRIVYDERQPVGFNAAEVVSEAREAGERIARRLQLDPRSRWPVVGV